jgi:hypothetical protein
MTQVFSNPEHDLEFWKKGYVVLPLLSENDAAELLARMNALRPDDNYAPDPSKRRYSTYHCTFLDTNLKYRRDAAQLLNEYFEEPIKRVLKNYKILVSNFYVKQPGKGKFEMHMNWHTAPTLQEVTLTVWCPLVPVGKSNGSLKIIEGSHKINFDVACATTDFYFKNIESELIQKYFKTFDLRPGECVIFDDTLVHYSDENLSEITRPAVQIETIPDTTTPVLYALNRERNVLEIFSCDSEWWLTADMKEVFSLGEKQAKLGEVKNRNKLLTIQEFDELMSRPEWYRDKVMKDDDSFM